MSIRAPAVAGQFYPEPQEDCRTEAARLLSGAPAPAAENARVIGGIVPHA